MAKRYEETRTRLGNAIVPNDYKFRGSLAVALFRRVQTYQATCGLVDAIVSSFLVLLLPQYVFVQHEGI